MTTNKYYTIVGLCVLAIIFVVAVFGFGVFSPKEQPPAPAQVATPAAPTAPVTPDAVPTLRQYTATCGTREVMVFVGADGRMLLQSYGEAYDLYPVVAASGAKYSTAETTAPQVVFWNKGNEATLEIDGAPAEQCVLSAVEEKEFVAPTDAPAAETAEAVVPEDVAVAAAVDSLTADTPAAAPVTATGEWGKIEGVQWQASSMSGKPLDEQVVVTMELVDGRISGRSGCNRYTGPYALDVEARSLKVTGPVAGTRMACPPAQMDAENAFNALLPTITAYSVDENGVLVLFAGQEEALRFSPVAAISEGAE